MPSKPKATWYSGICSECAKPFETYLPQKLTCSTECSNRRRLLNRVRNKAESRLTNRQDTSCAICEAVFTPRRKALYCSKRCGNYAAHLRKKFGLSSDEYKEMRRQQGGTCAVCGGGGDLVVDHCHSSGRVRSLLCGGCNTAIGYIEEDPRRAIRLAEYLELQSDVL